MAMRLQIYEHHVKGRKNNIIIGDNDQRGCSADCNNMVGLLCARMPNRSRCSHAANKGEHTVGAYHRRTQKVVGAAGLTMEFSAWLWTLAMVYPMRLQKATLPS